MSEIIISEKQLAKLIETAMDLDIYVQPKSFDTSNGNEDVEGSLKEMISKMEEILMMFKNGKKVFPEEKSELFKNFDNFNSIYEKIKFNN